MGWLDKLLTPKPVQDALDEQEYQHKQLERNLKDYQRGLLETEELLRGNSSDVKLVS